MQRGSHNVAQGDKKPKKQASAIGKGSAASDVSRTGSARTGFHLRLSTDVPYEGMYVNRTLYVFGMAAFFSTCISQVMMPPLFFRSDPADTEAMASLVLMLVALVSALAYLLCRAYRLTTRNREVIGLAACLTVTTAIQLAAFAGLFPADLMEGVRWVHVLMLAPTLVLLSIVWAGVCDYADGRVLRILIPLAMLLSVGFGVGCRVLGQALLWEAGTAQSMLPLVSGILGICLLERLSIASHRENTANEVEFLEFHPTGEVKGSRSLLAAWIGLWVFLVGGSVFVGFYSQGFKLDALSGGAHILAVSLLAAAIIVVARLSEKRLIRFQVLIIMFMSLCLLALYATALWSVERTVLAKSMLLPVRACAIFFSWLILEEFCRERNVSFPSVAAPAFFPLLLGTEATIVFAWVVMSSAGLTGANAAGVIAAFMLGTAFLTTLAAFFVIRYGWGADSEGRFGRKLADQGQGKPLQDELLQGNQRPGNQTRDEQPQGAPAQGAQAQGASAQGASAAASSLADGQSGQHVTEEQALEQVRIRYGLTNREFDVLRLTMQGHTQKGMADELYLSVNSVSTYVKALHAKLGVHSRQETVDLVRSFMDGQIA